MLWQMSNPYVMASVAHNSLLLFIELHKFSQFDLQLSVLKQKAVSSLYDVVGGSPNVS